MTRALPQAVRTATARLARAAGLVRTRRRRPLPLDPEESAKIAQCRYVDDRSPGIRRLRCGKGFRFVRPDGSAVKDTETLARIRGLVIPPAWTDVWICPAPDGHIQATGRDARGRKQYRYHPRFREIREETKYERMLAFAEALPRIRARVDEDLSLPGLSRDKVLATVVRLLEITLIRVGNEEYAQQNGSFGLTTMRTRHVDVKGSTLRFHFRGKSGKDHDVEVSDRRIARVVARCNDLPGEVLFQYAEDDGLKTVEADDVNDYLKRITEQGFTAKDFRTWAGTVLAAHALAALTFESATKTAVKRNVLEAVRAVSARLGNTPTVCRKCYVHPEIFGAYEAGELESLRDRAAESLRSGTAALSPSEMAVLALLRDRLGKRTLPAAVAERATTPHAA